ncbi:MAG TPA: thioredoxin domain-containing protein, partial [Candidatus Limnocylindria bacterium]
PLPLFGLVFYLGAIWLTIRALDTRSIAGLSPEAALVGLAIAGAVASAVLTALELFVIRAFCSWCLVQAAASFALLVAAILLMHTPTEPVVAHSRRTRQQAARAREGERSSLLRTGRAGGAVATLAVVALLALGAGGETPTGSPGPSGIAPAGSPRLGSGAIEVVEFADFQCPGCAVLAPIVADLASANEMTLVSRYFPLDAIHPNADRSARAAAAADRQGSFWQMSAALYARQDSWKDLSGNDADAFFTSLAGELGLDTAQWQASYASSEIVAVVDVDRQAAITMGLNSTPTLFIGGTHYTGPLTADGIRAAIAAVSP